MRTLEINDYWLMGRCLILEKQGLSPKGALGQAVMDWQEQEELERAFEQEHA